MWRRRCTKKLGTVGRSERSFAETRLWTSVGERSKVSAMFGRFVFCGLTMLSVATALAVPKGSAKRELQQLVRLPIVEFGTPLDFHRRFGFVAFPNENMAARDAAQMQKERKEGKDVSSGVGEALLHLSLARVHDAQGDANGAMRQYARALDL